MPQDVQVTNKEGPESISVVPSGFSKRATFWDLAVVACVLIGYLSFFSFITDGHVKYLPYGEKLFLLLGGAAAFHINIKVMFDQSRIRMISNTLRLVNLIVSAITVIFAFYLVPMLLMLVGSDDQRGFAIPALIFLALVITPVLDPTDKVKKFRKKD